MQIHGSKEFLLWPPADFDYLSYAALPGIHLNFTCCPPIFKKHHRPDGGHPLPLSTVDIRQPEKTPKLLQTSPKYVRVEPGDALVVPAYWSHLVLSHPGDAQACNLCDAIANLAVNFWFKPHRPRLALFALNTASANVAGYSESRTAEL